MTIQKAIRLGTQEIFYPSLLIFHILRIHFTSYTNLRSIKFKKQAPRSQAVEHIFNLHNVIEVFKVKEVGD